MATLIAPYTEDRVPAVKDFNLRIARAEGYEEFQLPDVPARSVEGRRIAEEYFLAIENGAVRGGYILNHQDFSFRGEVRRVAHYRLPLSEGIANRAYAGVGVQMVRTALKAQPLLFALGMGGMDRPLPQMLKCMGWRLLETPFFFRVNHARAFLRELRMLGPTPGRRWLARIARWSGAGPLGIHAVQRFRKRNSAAAFEPVTSFDAWADALWERANYRYAMIAARDGGSLNALYPPSDGRFLRLRVRKDGAIAGWAVLLDTAMRGDRHFGNLRVGTIADCLALPEDAGAVIAAAAQFLEERGVDLIISNQANRSWGAALARCGFLSGPSNYVLALSKQLAQLVAPFEENSGEIHVNRGDGDGPIHL